MNDFTLPPLTEEDVILNSKLEHLYNHEFKDGRFFQVIFSDENENENENEIKIKLAARTCLKVVYLKDKDDIEGFEIIKVVSNKEKERVKLSKFNMEQLICFLELIKDLDFKGINKRRISLADDELSVLDADTKAKITTLLSGEDGSDVVYELLDKGLITNQDLVNTGYRKYQLELFESLLFRDGLANYKTHMGSPDTKDETAWQHFFQANEWIFGYGLDYRFQGILQKEFHASTSNAAGKDEVIADFLLGDKRFTTFVELKLPNTKLFNKSKNRSNCWSLSNSLIDAFSQILEQKASGQLKIENTKELIGDNDEEITQRSYDSKTILLMGSWSQIENDSIGIKRIKEKTLELFRRDSRNVELVTYDELYERARFIVHNEKHSKRS